MTQSRKNEIIRLMSQMDIDMQNYVIDMLRHLKFAQVTLTKKNNLARKRRSKPAH